MKLTESSFLKSGTLLGYTKTHKSVFCADDAKHILIGGTTGAGKTVTISNFVLQAMKQKYGLLIVDGKGDTGSSSLFNITMSLCKQYNRKLYVVDMNNPDTSDKYNPFRNANATIIKDMLINLSEWTEEHYKLNVERYLQKVITLLLKDDENINLQKIVDSIDKDSFIELSKKLLSKDLINKNEHIKNMNLAEHSAKISEDASARFATILESDIGQILNSAYGIDIYSALNEKAVILFILNPLLYPETAEAFGKLILIDSKKAVSRLFDDTERKFFIFDEINVYASRALLNLVNKSRSANVTCVLATQSLVDLESAEDEAFREQVIENCNNYIIMRQNSFKSAEEWSKIIGTRETMKLTYQLQGTEAPGPGSARRTREFIVHPDRIKSLGVGEAYFISKDNRICEFVKIDSKGR